MHRYFEYQEKETYSSKFIKILIKLLNKKKSIKRSHQTLPKKSNDKKRLVRIS